MIVDVPAVDNDLVLLNVDLLDTIQLPQNTLAHRLISPRLLKPRVQSQNTTVYGASAASENVTRIQLSRIQNGIVLKQMVSPIFLLAVFCHSSND